MQGKVLGYDQAKATGIILNDEGVRYQFVAENYKGEGEIKVGQMVDFMIEEDRAVEIYPLHPVAITNSTAYANHNSSQDNAISKKLIAGLLALFLGCIGVHKFYLGNNKQGIIMLAIFFGGFILLGLPSMVIGAIGFIEGVLYLTKTDEEFERIYVQGKKAWF